MIAAFHDGIFALANQFATIRKIGHLRVTVLLLHREVRSSKTVFLDKHRAGFL